MHRYCFVNVTSSYFYRFGRCVLRRSNSRGSRFNADDCKKKEEADSEQDGGEEARSQGCEEESREEEAEGEEIVA